MFFLDILQFAEFSSLDLVTFKKVQLKRSNSLVQYHTTMLDTICWPPICFNDENVLSAHSLTVTLYFKINKMVFKTANVFDLIDHHQV